MAEIIGYVNDDGYNYEFMVCGKFSNSDNLLFIRNFENAAEAYEFVKTVRNGVVVHDVTVCGKEKVE